MLNLVEKKIDFLQKYYDSVTKHLVLLYDSGIRFDDLSFVDSLCKNLKETRCQIEVLQELLEDYYDIL